MAALAAIQLAQEVELPEAAEDAAESDGSGGPEGQPVPPPPFDSAGMLGSVAWLMMSSPAHKHLFITDFEWLVVPPILHKQFRIWRRRNVPVAYACWAYLNEAAETRLRNGVRRLAPGEWKSGDNLWLVDLVAPFGGGEAAARDLKETVFKGQRVKTLQPSPDGSGFAVVEW